jgi:hypothetical protein
MPLDSDLFGKLMEPSSRLLDITRIGDPSAEPGPIDGSRRVRPLPKHPCHLARHHQTLIPPFNQADEVSRPAGSAPVPFAHDRHHAWIPGAA